MSYRIFAGAATAMLTLAGCASPPQSATQVQAAQQRQGDLFVSEYFAEKRVTYLNNQLRMADEQRLTLSTGTSQPLPTGDCRAHIRVVTATGAVAGLTVKCDNPALVKDLRAAILRAAPFSVPAGETALDIALIMMSPDAGMTLD